MKDGSFLIFPSALCAFESEAKSENVRKAWKEKRAKKRFDHTTG